MENSEFELSDCSNSAERQSNESQVRCCSKLHHWKNPNQGDSREPQHRVWTYFYPNEACRTVLSSIILLLRLQKVVTPLAIWQHAFFSICRSQFGRFHAQRPPWVHFNSRVLVDDRKLWTLIASPTFLCFEVSLLQPKIKTIAFNTFLIEGVERKSPSVYMSSRLSFISTAQECYTRS